MIKNEKQENTEKQQIYNNSCSGFNTVLYTGMNGKPVTLWKFILGIILLVGGFLCAIMIAI